MRNYLCFLLFLLLTIQSLATQAQESPENRYFLGPAMKIIPHHEASTGILMGLTGTKILRNRQYQLHLTFLKNINTMESAEGEGYEFQSFYYSSFGVGRNLFSITENLTIHAQAAAGLGFVKIYDGFLSDDRGIGWSGFFSLEPGLTIHFMPVKRLRLAAGSSFIFNIKSSEELEFRRPVIDFGVQFNF